MRRAHRVALFLASVSLTFAPAAVRSQSTLPPASMQESIPESAEVSDESARALRAQVLNLFQTEQYGPLSDLAQQLRLQRTRFRGGAWQLKVLYGVIDSPGSVTATDSEWDALLKKLQGWMAADPASPTPRLALAQAYLTFAWKARGNGFSNTVTEQGWASFKERVQLARTTLEDARSVSTNCPEWYREMQTVALAQGWPRAQEEVLARAALAHDPGYYYFALAESNYLLPKWYGKPGDTEIYAEQVADAVGGREGDALYFLIAAHVNCCRQMQAPGLNEARVQKGFAALEQLYGSTNHQRNEAAFLAVRAGDTAAAQAMFARIGEDWSATVWQSKARFDATRTGQTIGNVEPLRASSSPGTSTLPNTQ